MASARKCVCRDGSTTHQVRWREGGARDGTPQSEVFDSEPDAKQFQSLVDAHRQHWPPGWVKGEGFVQPGEGFVQPGEDGKNKTVASFATRAEHFVETLTGVEIRTRHDYRREIRNHFIPFFRDKDICDAEAITSSDIRRWVNALEPWERDKKNKEEWVRKPLSPKTLANLHGTLYSIFQSAVEAQPQLRAANPCALTRLPRVDNGIEDEMVFLEREEFDRVKAAMAGICTWGRAGTGPERTPIRPGRRRSGPAPHRLRAEGSPCLSLAVSLSLPAETSTAPPVLRVNRRPAAADRRRSPRCPARAHGAGSTPSAAARPSGSRYRGHRAPLGQQADARRRMPPSTRATPCPTSESSDHVRLRYGFLHCRRTTPPQVLTIDPVSAPPPQALPPSASVRTSGQFHSPRDRPCPPTARQTSTQGHSRLDRYVPRLTSRRCPEREETATARQHHR
ncbi:hypothetical protein [Streptomyces sp. NBC_01622]|uniref:hypothetical protein n=1 Tax=Streptomyces sp. NBC_01622 TaxID=2975903 RepID=UPI003863C32A